MYTHMNSYPNLLNLYRGKYQGMMEPMSRMTMDFQGRYLDSMGRLVDPKQYDYYNNWHSNDQYYGLFMLNKHTWMDNKSFNWDDDWSDYPERYIDMSNYQMDMQGRWMDMQGRYVNPFNQWWYNRHDFYPAYSYGTNTSYPERWTDMSNYQMDKQGHWMDMYGRRVNPFSYSVYYPQYYYSGHWDSDHPERYMDMSGYQMDMQGRWMDMQGRYCNPFSNYSGWYNMQYPGNYPYFGSHPQRYMNVYRLQMDNHGQWIDNRDQYVDHY